MREPTSGSLEDKLWTAYRRGMPVLLHRSAHTRLLIAHNNLTQGQIRRVASRMRDHDGTLRQLLSKRCREGDLKSARFLEEEVASGRRDSTLQRVIVAKPFVVENSAPDEASSVEFKKKRRKATRGETDADDDGSGLVYFMLETKVIRTRKPSGATPRRGPEPTAGGGAIYCAENNAVPLGALVGLLEAY